MAPESSLNEKALATVTAHPPLHLPAPPLDLHRIPAVLREELHSLLRRRLKMDRLDVLEARRLVVLLASCWLSLRCKLSMYRGGEMLCQLATQHITFKLISLSECLRSSQPELGCVPRDGVCRCYFAAAKSVNC